MEELLEIRKNYFNKPCILSLVDEREVFGEIKCVDKYGFVVLKNVIVSLPE